MTLLTSANDRACSPLVRRCAVGFSSGGPRSDTRQEPAASLVIKRYCAVTAAGDCFCYTGSLEAA